MARRQQNAYANSDVAFQSPKTLNKRHIIAGDTGELRFLDAAITAGVAMGSALWTATRPSGQDIAWGFFWTGLGALMFVEGKGELSAGGAGVMGANAAYLGLRFAGKINNP